MAITLLESCHCNNISNDSNSQFIFLIFSLLSHKRCFKNIYKRKPKNTEDVPDPTIAVKKSKM